MKKIFIITGFFLYIFFTGKAQYYVSFYTEDGQKFWLILNGIKINQEPEYTVSKIPISTRKIHVKIIFFDEQIPTIDKTFEPFERWEISGHKTFIIKQKNNQYFIDVFNPLKENIVVSGEETKSEHYTNLVPWGCGIQYQIPIFRIKEYENFINNLNQQYNFQNKLVPFQNNFGFTIFFGRQFQNILPSFYFALSVSSQKTKFNDTIGIKVIENNYKISFERRFISVGADYLWKNLFGGGALGYAYSNLEYYITNKSDTISDEYWKGAKSFGPMVRAGYLLPLRKSSIRFSMNCYLQLFSSRVYDITTQKAFKLNVSFISFDAMYLW